MENIIKRGENLSEFFKKANINIDFSSQYEAQQKGAAYFDRLQKDILSAAPDALASTLVNNEFIYLTFDTPEIRKAIIQQQVTEQSQSA